jgi:hypothetical protein
MSELDAVLQAAKSHGASDEFLVNLLEEQGWPQSDIYAALGRHYAAATGIAIPDAPGRLESAREAFFHLLAFATLAAWIFSTGSLWFELIDTWFPDPARLRYQDWQWSRVSWQMASILVGFPVFLYATRTILAEMARNPDKAVSPVRRWLTNIALLVTALVFVGDLVTFVAWFLQGELTVRFVLKCVTVFILAGAVFLYYNHDATKPPDQARLWNRGFAIASAAAILLSVVVGMMSFGVPGENRLRAQDRRRVEDLFQIASRMHAHWSSQSESAPRRLPAKLDELIPGTGGALPLLDPFRQTPYAYTPAAAPAYRLCADFGAETRQSPGGQPPAWSHPAGVHCFDLDASLRPVRP